MKKEFKDYLSFEEEKLKCRDCQIGLAYDKTVSSMGCKNSPKVVVIGDSPSKDDLAEGEPFSGQPGQLLRRTLNSNGFRRENALITNIIPCMPAGGRLPRDKDIVRQCVERWLSNELLILRPEYILLIGDKAMSFVMGISGITKNRGTWLPYASPLDASYRANVMTTFHPLYVLKQQNEKDGASIRKTFEKDIRTFAMTSGILSA